VHRHFQNKRHLENNTDAPAGHGNRRQPNMPRTAIMSRRNVGSARTAAYPDDA